MKNKKGKSNYSNYRKQLIQLAKFYGIDEIKNYFKSAKRLTNNQLELILIKNKIRLPSNRSLQKISNFTISSNKYFKQLFYTATVIIIIVGFFGGLAYIAENFHKIDSELWKDKQ